MEVDGKRHKSWTATQRIYIGIAHKSLSKPPRISFVDLLLQPSYTRGSSCHIEMCADSLVGSEAGLAVLVT